MSALSRFVGLTRGFGKALERSDAVPTRGPEVPVETPKLTNGGSVQVVGESFYPASFSRLLRREKQLHEGKWRHDGARARLEVEPGNPHSKSGKAVAVLIDGEQVGHIPEPIAPIFFDFLSSIGGVAECECRIYFDRHGTRSSISRERNSVTLYTLTPPVLAEPRTQFTLPSLAEGDVRKFLGRFERVESEGSVLEVVKKRDTFIGPFNLFLRDDHVEIASVDGRPLLSSVTTEPSPREIFRGSSMLLYVTLAVTKESETYTVAVYGDSNLSHQRTLASNSLNPQGRVLSRSSSIFLAPQADSWVKMILSKPSLPEKANILSELIRRVGESGAIYAWAEGDGKSGFVSPETGVRAICYQKDRDRIERNFSLAQFYALLRIDVSHGKATVSVNLHTAADYLPFAVRPLIAEATGRLQGSEPIVLPKAPSKTKPRGKLAEPPAYSLDFELSALEKGAIVGTQLTILEEVVLSAARSLRWPTDSKVTKSRTSILLVGENFQIEDTGKAHLAAKYLKPIVPMRVFREKARDSLLGSPIYEALERYEAWIKIMDGDVLSNASPVKKLLDRKIDLYLIPGGSVDPRSPSQDLRFSETLKVPEESKPLLRQLFPEAGGRQRDTIIFQAEARRTEDGPRTEVRFFRNDLLVAGAAWSRTGALDGTRFRNTRTSWVRLDWTSTNGFRASLDLDGS